METSPTPSAGPPPDGAAAQIAELAACLSEHTHTVEQIMARLDEAEAHQQEAAAETAARFDGMRTAFSDLRSKVSNLGEGPGLCKDDQRRRLIEFLGYEPTSEQQMQLFAAFAAWHATEPRLVENRQAEYATKRGGVISYGYADLAGVIATGQTAAAMGLCAVTRQELDDVGNPVVTGYLVHSGGGAISSGPVPLFIGDSERRGQAHAAGLTTCRRLALQMVLGLAAERDDDFNASSETSAPRAAARPSSGQQRPQQPVRTVTTPPRATDGGSRSSATTRTGPPPGWISKADRQALEQELRDPAITPARFQEIEERLLAADQLAANSRSGEAG